MRPTTSWREMKAMTAPNTLGVCGSPVRSDHLRPAWCSRVIHAADDQQGTHRRAEVGFASGGQQLRQELRHGDHGDTQFLDQITIRFRAGQSAKWKAGQGPIGRDQDREGEGQAVHLFCRHFELPKRSGCDGVSVNPSVTGTRPGRPRSLSRESEPGRVLESLPDAPSTPELNWKLEEGEPHAQRRPPLKLSHDPGNLQRRMLRRTAFAHRRTPGMRRVLYSRSGAARIDVLGQFRS